MFKSTWSYLIPSWSKKPSTTTTVEGEIPQSFTVKGANDKNSKSHNLYNISMNEANEVDEFIDISYKKLSYAEVAALSKNKQQTSKLSKPQKERTNANQFTVLPIEDASPEEDLESSMYLPEEKFKINNYFKKNKKFKSKDKSKK